MDDLFQKFVAACQDVVSRHYAKHFPGMSAPEVGFDAGPKYWRVWSTTSGGRQVYGFVRKEDGAILRPDGWKKPTKIVMGYLDRYDPLILTEYGIAYVRR